MGTGRGAIWRFALAALALCFALAVAGCGGSSSDSDVTMNVVSGTSAEERVLAQIYGQALAAAGYDVNVRVDAEPGLAMEELIEGRIAGFPQHLKTALTDIVGVPLQDVPANPAHAYEELNERLAGEGEGFTAFPPAPFELSNAIGLTRHVAEAKGLKTDSDLPGKSEEMTLKGGRTCHTSVDCLGGLERYYGIHFGGFSAVDPTARYEVLEDGKADASVLFTTDGRLAGSHSRFAILDEDKHAFPAGNGIWLTRKALVERAGPDYEKAIVAAQKGLTPPVVQRLDAQVELQHRPPAKVAAGYLESIGYEG